MHSRRNLVCRPPPISSGTRRNILVFCYICPHNHRHSLALCPHLSPHTLRTGYDGVKVDVWAAGVLLYVMLVGMFPFETQDDNFNNTAGLYDIWLQQVSVGRWGLVGDITIVSDPETCPATPDITPSHT